ncbi:large conductance mechanosensitive channel protein MscL [Arenivirga flava]|uniref:Large-conductance mechanosensitive channel n=1 Tax=Arenivirga flava TaxID=1930060 RepID=A0AA37XCK2_9MICO|nr:large-conductance mechanosensitive channel [Arenivirga flava]
MTVLKGFKDFILRGNVIELAVAVVIGASFTAIVNGFVTGIINPVLALLFDTGDLAAATVPLGMGRNAPELGYGIVISAIIQFIMVAAVVYFALIVPMNYLKKVQFRKKAEEPAVVEPAPPTDTELLVEIRDLLQSAHNDRKKSESA